MDYSTAYALAGTIRASEEYRVYHTLKEQVMSDDTTAALIREYRKLQMELQMISLNGGQPDAEETQRFTGISTLLFSKEEVSQFLLAEMRMQQMLGDIFKIVTEAADIEVTLPGT